jgi:hypothetical protein
MRLVLAQEYGETAPAINTKSRFQMSFIERGWIAAMDCAEAISTFIGERRFFKRHLQRGLP